MAVSQQREDFAPQPFRLDVRLHDLLTNSPAPKPLLVWNCRAGQNSIIIRRDGTLAPCFPLYSATHDWDTIENHKFDVPQLNEMKKTCHTHCFSTLNHNLGFCYDDSRVIKWVLKQAPHGFQDVTGSFTE